MLSIQYHRNHLDFILSDSNYFVSVADFKQAYVRVDGFLLDILNVELIEKVEIHINCLELLKDSIDVDLSIFTGCKELVIHSGKVKTGINFCMLPTSLERLIIKYDTYREKAIINLDNLPANIKYLVVAGVVVSSFCYLPAGLVELNMYECYQNCSGIIELPPNVSEFKCTYVSRNFKVENKIEKAYHSSGWLDIPNNYLEGGIIKTFG